MKYFVDQKRATALFLAAGLLVASVLPMLASVNKAYAEQITERKITLSSSKLSQANVTYASSFKATQATVIRGLVIDFCQNSPLIGDACTNTNGVAAVPTTGTVTFTNTGGTGDLTFEASGAGGNTLRLSDADGVTGGDGFTPDFTNAITFSFTATNPTGTSASPGTPGTFYGRVLTYALAATATGYASATPGTYLDYGGIALSTTNSLTVSAVVQEVLQFCVGGTTNNDDTTSIANDCASSFTGSGTCGNTVNLGVLDSGSVSTSPVATGAPVNGNACNGAAMVRTNAANGVNIAYYAEQDAGTNKLGALRVPGATCDVGASNTDRCIDSAGVTQSPFTAGVEEYGMSIAGINCGSTSAYTCSFAASSNKVSRNAQYDGNSATVFGSDGATGYAWDESGTPTSIASSTGVVDDEALIMHFAATPNVTTPTGSYTVKANLIATSTF